MTDFLTRVLIGVASGLLAAVPLSVLLIRRYLGKRTRGG